MAELRTYIPKNSVRTVVPALEELSGGRFALRMKEARVTDVSLVLSGEEAAALGLAEPSTPTPIPTPEPVPAPAGGVLFGGRIGYPDLGTVPWATTALSRWEANIGKECSYVQFGQPFGQFDQTACETLWRLGIVPQLEQVLKAPAGVQGTQQDVKGGTSWTVTDGANGLLDDRFRAFCVKAKAWGDLDRTAPGRIPREFVYRFLWEPNGPWMDTYYGYNACFAHSRPADYVRMWRRFRAIAREVGCTNMKWLWCPNWWNAQQSGAKEPTPWDPGSDQYDLAGLNGYADYATIDTILGAPLARVRALAPGKPIYWETGVCKSGGNNHPPPTGMSPEAWIKDVFAKLPNYDVDIFQWFNAGEGTRDSVSVEQSAAVLAAFKAGIADARYLPQARAVLA
jgi:hypothetical protein